ncbi:hypothetical protein ED312_02820 [Sinomicrobium pectinilyticum]|uniref:DUF4625 domain-containing protein n=1 Tax=Sinomicrobium pectinilyticum TaxID=1084421 RepID=A0A3N0EYH9_SINP1|nr:hypothetical protein [Sinomicrobium pectinilyticum]RNL92960.1 hypothetical protein ED312_02820 [Sinomicrobium pectinilyticum]
MKKSILLALILLSGITASATETRIIVRAKAKDAKFIGSSLGGAHVIIRDKTNNRILAEGKTSGSTGNTDLIMNTPKQRESSIADEQTARFLATINIDEPTFVNIEVLSPFNNKQAQVKATTELWLIPGKHILGEGIILEIPGFIIDILKPRTHQYISLSTVKDTPIRVKANIVMMCGCVINKGGTWDSEDMEVKGILKKDGKHIKNIDMSLTETNLFEGNIPVESAGNYELTVYAYNPESGNTGVDKVNYVIHD